MSLPYTIAFEVAMIAFSCHKCGKEFKLKPEFAGRKTTCSACKESLVVPSPDQTMGYDAPAHTIAPPSNNQIAFSCSKCGMKFSVKLEFAGRTTKCPACKESLVVPTPDQTMGYEPAVGQIKGAPSSLAKAGVDGGVTLGGTAETATGQSSLQNLMNGKSNEGARYIVESEIARGGMGAVLRAVDCDIRREVAVKYLLDQSDPKKKLRFVEEAQITGQLEHPNIVPIHELAVDAQQRIFFSMKMVKGRSLAEILKLLQTDPAHAEKEYTLGKLLNIFVNICHALAYAHSRCVVHRDIKPANIMVGDFGEVYVMDWGLAKVLKKGLAASPETGPVMAIPVAILATPAGSPPAPFEDSGSNSALPLALPVKPGGSSFSAGSGQVITSRDLDAELTQEGAVLGTPVYMPPEQASGQLHHIDERSDIYAMGAILYEMITLQPPINKEGGYWAILMRVTQGEIVLPEAKDPQRTRTGKVPAELSAVAMKALAKKPAGRYQRIELMRQDIERFLEGRSVSAKEDTRKEVVIKFVKRNQAFSAVTAAAAVLLFIVVTWSMIANFQERRATQRAYDAYAVEQKDKEERTRRAVPALVEIARRDAEAREFKKALDQARLALEYDPSHTGARLLHGQLLMVEQDFKTAAGELTIYLAKHPGDAQVRELKSLSDRAEANSKEIGPQVQIAQILTAQNCAGMAEGLLRHYGRNGDEVRNELLTLYRKRIDSAWPGRGAALTLDKEGHFHMSAYGEDIKDLTVLKDIPLRTISVSGKQIRDLSGLQGMPLVRIELTNCGDLKDVNALSELPLTSFQAQHCHQLESLAGLKGMPLTSLDLLQAPLVRDLSWLQGMPLTTLRLAQCIGVSDLAGLQGLKLQALEISGCAGVRDLTPLNGLPLKSLNLMQCGNVRELAPLKGMLLTTLNLAGCSIVQDLAPLEGMPLTNLDLTNCTEVRSLEALRDLPLKELNLANCNLLASLKGIEKLKLTTLTLNACVRIDDISAVKDMPLTNIMLSGCAELNDLSPLKGMAFTTLHLDGMVKLTDLSPLKGMPLNRLILNNCVQLSDLKPLKGMPLNHVDLINCVKIADLTPLKEAVIQHITLQGCSGLKTLDGLQGMRFSKIDLTGCTNLENLDGLKGVPINQFLIGNCPKITNLNSLKEMPLNNCHIADCANLVDISGLGGKRLMGNLAFNNCPKLEDWSPLKDVSNQFFAVSNCQHFKDLSLLEAGSINSISITDCGKTIDLSPLKHAKLLTSLSLGQFSELTDITPLKGLKLTQLYIPGSAVKDLTPIRSLPLTHLHLEKCVELRDLSPLKGMILQSIGLPPQVIKGMDELRAMKSLGSIDGRPAEQFWKQWDASQTK